MKIINEFQDEQKKLVQNNTQLGADLQSLKESQEKIEKQFEEELLKSIAEKDEAIAELKEKYS